MKVSTDGILLGAWADVKHCKNILDMGSGTGLLALMLAQRTEENCQIQAVELIPLQQNKHKKTSTIQCGKIAFNLFKRIYNIFYKPLHKPLI